MYFFAVFVLLGTGLRTADAAVKTNVICKESTMTIEVLKSSIPKRIMKDHLRLSDPTNTACSLHANETHIYAHVPLSSCGTELKEDTSNLIFKNEITMFEKNTDLITRKDLMELQFQCTYPKRGKVTQNFKAPRQKVTVVEKGLGMFTYQFEFYRDSLFQNRIDPSTYPVQCKLGSRIFMQIEATSSVNNTVLFVETCRAAPYDNPNYQPTYSIIEDGCLVEQTAESHLSSARKTQFRFSLEAFKFIGLHDQVYISCAVMMCDAGDSNTRCATGCIPTRRRRELGKREAVIQTLRHHISQGPLRLTRSAELTGRPAMNLNLNLVFVAGCLLAAVAMISAVAVYKTKMSSLKYQPLPVYES